MPTEGSTGSCALSACKKFLNSAKGENHAVTNYITLQNSFGEFDCESLFILKPISIVFFFFVYLKNPIYP